MPDQAIQFVTEILKFGKKGEKTGWTYIEVPSKVVNKLFPGNKKSFRVKGHLDNYKINGIALLPMGEGNFIMPLNASLRKKVGKKEGEKLKVKLILDLKRPSINHDLMNCLHDEPEALSYFNKLPPSHKQYFSNWIESAKTSETKAKRIARTINALLQKMHYGQMLKAGN